MVTSRPSALFENIPRPANAPAVSRRTHDGRSLWSCCAPSTNWIHTDAVFRCHRRDFLTRSALMLLGATTFAREAADEPIIDIHQHLGYVGRSDAALLAHQRAIGATTTILLPAGRPASGPSTHQGLANGLQAEALGNEACARFARAHRPAFLFGANEVPDLKDATREIERYLKRGAVVIAEQKFGMECDSADMQKIYTLAGAYDVPVLMHWQFGM